MRELTGCDGPVAAFLRQQPEVALMRSHIEQFLTHWLDFLANNHRSYVTVAIGCTGGQHRSVYLAERLGAALKISLKNIQVRHRDIS